ncbi:hypothetical protein VNI00_006886 [Paramarasmius palmivorus]|uniref:UDP-Glycosyltransferase/glycogen phosphorylase n=1 Tax=Paramarasmius palmivorus TaxID=297713 RepID=A0AAW0D8Z3_9AGAR
MVPTEEIVSARRKALIHALRFDKVRASPFPGVVRADIAMPEFTILLITNSEYGQANVILAVAYELVQRPNVKIHIASFSPLRKRVGRLQTLIADEGSANIIEFHEIAGLSHEEILVQQQLSLAKDTPHPPGYHGAVKSYCQVAAGFLHPWTAEEYHERLLSIERIVERLNPSRIVVDSLLTAGWDVCRKLGRPYMVLSPNSPKDFAWIQQPGLRGFWKYPAPSSGFPCPVPLHLIPANISLILRLLFIVGTSSRIRQLDAIRKEYGVKTGILEQFSNGVPYIFPAMLETEFSGFQILPNVHLAGPIILPYMPVEEPDPQLAQWLSNPGTKTVLINLGSHVIFNLDHARCIAGGIRILLDRVPEVQVLWKLIPDGEIRNVLDEAIGKYMEAGKVKVVEWLEAEPYAVLCHPNTVCSAHHGGANSFFEAISAGVSHVVLPIWFDTYDYARRVELFGIGVWGNPSNAPYAETKEFGGALVKVIGGREGGEMARNAKALAEVYRSKYGGNGRKTAADWILGGLHPMCKV